MTLAIDEEDEVRLWPAVYDQDELIETIKSAAAIAPQRFFSFRSAPDPQANQGDVLEMPSELPVLDHEGAPSTDRPVTYWLVVGNSCDVQRAYDDADDVFYVSIAPLIPLSSLGEDAAEAELALRQYKTGRSFYVPGWKADIEPHVADLTKMAPMHRLALRERATIQARMTPHAWILLNACLVRLLARDDERYR